MNAGVCIVKNTNWTKQFMKQWWDAGETFKGGDATIYNVPEEHKEIVGYYKNAIWHDQTCLTILYDRHADVRNLIKIIPYRRLNWNVPDGNPFVFHAFAFGSLPLRTIDGVYARTFGIPPDTSSLKSLAAIYPTDRDHRHDFFKVYDPLFCRMKDIKNLIEVGWWDGNSLEIWSRYFPKAKIWCVDAKAPDYNNEIGNIQTLKIDNRNADELEAYGKSVSDIDVIVDDASHSMKDQQTIFGKLFKSLKSGGVFIIEDLHSSVECRMPGKEWCNWGDPTKTTTLDVLNLYNETGKIQSDYLTVEQCEYLENNIASCEILTGHVESLTSIIKKK